MNLVLSPAYPQELTRHTSLNRLATCRRWTHLQSRLLRAWWGPWMHMVGMQARPWDLHSPSSPVPMALVAFPVKGMERAWCSMTLVPPAGLLAVDPSPASQRMSTWGGGGSSPSARQRCRLCSMEIAIRQAPQTNGIICSCDGVKGQLAMILQMFH
jgi:hypothetical protein